MTVKPTVPGSLEDLLSSTDFIPTDLAIDETFRKSYEKFHESARKGDLGKTAQF